MKYNDLDMQNWKECDINTNSLWIINQRYKTKNRDYKADKTYEYLHILEK
jgi:hypothetical protein